MEGEKSSLNTNADALSRRKGPELTATTRIDAGLPTVQIHEAQRSDEVLSHAVIQSIENVTEMP